MAGRKKGGRGEGRRYRSIAKHGGTARDEPIGVRLKYKMGFEDSDGVTRRFNYCRPGATYNFCHRPIAAFHLSSPRARSSATPSPPARFFRPACDRSPIFSREHRFFSALLPEPQNGAKMRYRFAEPGLAADRSADLVRASIPFSSPLYPLLFYPFRCVDKHRPVSAFFSISILCSRDERRVLATIPRESPLDGDACDHVYLIDGRAKDGWFDKRARTPSEKFLCHFVDAIKSDL